MESDTPTPTVLNEWATAHFVKAGNSLARFGDGEVNIAFNGIDAFENYDEQLAERLREILQADHEGLGIGVPDIFSEEAKGRLTNPVFWPRYEDQLRKILVPGRTYYSNFFSRPDNCSRQPGTEVPNRSTPATVDPAYWELIRSICADRHILIINFNPALPEHEFFRGAAKVDFLPCAQRNIWDGGEGYRRLLSRAESAPGELVLAVAGPIGTVLAHDLHLAGRWAIDFGQVARIYLEGQAKEHMFLY